MSYGGRGRGGGSGGKLDVESLERDNDRGLDMLAERVGLLKSATHGIKSEVDGQQRILDSIEGGMLNVRSFLGSVNDKFRMVMADKQGKRTVLLAGVTAAVLFAIWYLSR